MKLKKILSLVVLLLTVLGLSFCKASSSDCLTVKQKDIALIASYTAEGNLDALEIALNDGLNNGLTVNEIKEVLVQMYAYCGFPRSLNSISSFIKVVDERKAHGIDDKIGNEGKPLSENFNKLVYGTKVQTELIGSPAQGEYIKFAPAIDVFLKEHLFADIFARGVLTNQEREIATIAALSTIKGAKPQLLGHIQISKNIGLTQEQIDAIQGLVQRNCTKTFKNKIFARGEKNTSYSQYFIGQSYLNLLNKDGVLIANVTFEPGCRNNWHIHHKGGQILLVTQGKGYYQEWGKAVRKLNEGDVVYIAPEIKHWHGATKDSWFVHLAVEIPAEGASNEWLEPVSDKEYNKIKE